MFRKPEINILYTRRNIIQGIAHDTSSDAIEFSTLRIQQECVIGGGAFGKVYRGKAYGISGNAGWTIVAIKTPRSSFFNFY